MPEEKLLPCPFCGNSLILIHEEPDVVFAKCTFCFAEGPQVGKEQSTDPGRDAAILWNKRVAPNNPLQRTA